MDKRELQRLLSQPYKQENWKEIIDFVFPNVTIFSSPQSISISDERIKQFKHFGNVRLSDGKNLALFEAVLSENVNIQRNRVALNEIISKKIDQDQIHGVLSVFEQGGEDYRFTFSAKSSEFDEEESDFVQKKTDTKRYTYVLGKNESCKTPADRFYNLSENKSDVVIQDIQHAFSVEKLSKEFFEKYKKHYEKFVLYLTGDIWKKKGNKYVLKQIQEPSVFLKKIFYGDKKSAREFVKKLLGRIVFIHFIQKKGWMGCPNEEEWGNGDKQFIFNLFECFSDKEHFHSKCLADLFYNTLNKKRVNDIFSCEGLKGSINNTKVPYLNGGLFDAEKLETRKIDFPESYFEELIEFFGQYNFTIDEDEPNDHEVGIDPEMLGHVFENLLEDNKDKGAFYTPKVIVEYMCQESLIEYLKTKLNNQNLDEINTAIEELIRNRTAEKSSDLDLIEGISKCLHDVKVCDPAIGSGAFPMGILNVIYHVIEKLWNVQPDTVARIWEISDSEWQPNLVKKDIIQNSIYGVDIESGAVDIARLRFWLALVVDEVEPLPLPNLDYKIMQGNSLLESFEGIDLSQISDAAAYEAVYESEQIDMFSGEAKKKATISLNFEDVKTLMDDYFSANDPDIKKDLHKRIDEQVLNHIRYTLSQHKSDLFKRSKQLKKKIKDKLEALSSTPQQQKIRTSSKEAKMLLKISTELEKYNQKEIALGKLSNSNESSFFLWHLFFQDVFEDGGFDIVIGNPPYLKVQNIPKEHAAAYKSLYKTPHNKYDIYVLFIEFAFNLIKEDGVICYINPHRFIVTEYGIKLREYLIEIKGLKRFLDFGVEMVFDNATAYTGIFLFSKNNEHVEYADITSRNLREHTLSHISYNLLNTTWMFTTSQRRIDIVEKILKHSDFFDCFLGVYQGVITIGDDIQILKGSIVGDYFEGYSKALDVSVTIEKNLMKPILKGENIRRYISPSTDLYIFYPHYVNADNKTVPYNEDEMKSLFPLGYEYIVNFKEDLIEKKIKYKTNPAFWYSLHRSRDLNLYTVPKLITPQLQNNSHFTFDNTNKLADAGGYVVVPNESYRSNMLGFLALFNSSIFYYFIKSTSTPYNNNYYYFKTNYITPFRISEMFLQKIEDFENLSKENLDSDRPDIEEKINILISKCYALDYEEFKEVSPESSISKEAYNNYENVFKKNI